MGEHGAGRQCRGIESAASEDARWRVHHGRAWGIEAIRRGIHGGLGWRVSAPSWADGAWCCFVIANVAWGAEGLLWYGAVVVLVQMKRCRGAHGQGREGDCRRLADYRIASGSERVRQKLVWGAAVVHLPRQT